MKETSLTTMKNILRGMRKRHLVVFMKAKVALTHGSYKEANAELYELDMQMDELTEKIKVMERTQEQ